MLDIKNRFKNIKKSYLYIAGVTLLVLLAVLLLFVNIYNSWQAELTVRIELYFKGEYRIADGPWQTYVEGEHIPATKGDVTLRGDLYKRYEGEDLGIYNREDQQAAFFADHINLIFCETDENGEKVYFVTDCEDPQFRSSNCGESWIVPTLILTPDQPIEIFIHNPHSFGNETAIDEMLSTMEIHFGISFEKGVLESGEIERNVGLGFLIVSMMLLGIALFSSLIHVKSHKIIWILGLVILFAGGYFTYGAEGVSVWNDSIVQNTTLLGASMMLYMFFFSLLAVCFLTVTRDIGRGIVIALGAVDAVIFIIPIVSKVLFYDTYIWWIAAQLIANAFLAHCLIKEFKFFESKLRWIYIGAFLPLISFVVDIFGTWLGVWQGGLISEYVFVALFVAAIMTVLKLIPANINAAVKARELEMEKIALGAELAESRISTMMSQIRPHFIYNTLGSIEQLCELDPPKAGELVHDFAKYLRGNFGELDNPKPILMSQEMDHVHHYVNIENVRFPDMTFKFEMNSADFRIPALTVQPIVENAIKHGLMKLEKGGTIQVVSYETETDFCVSVVDDGVGFDTGRVLDDRNHVGLRNIRERLKAMVGGTIEIESTVGVGTKVLIKIPKEAGK